MSTVQAFDASLDLLKALLWQHDNAEKLITLMKFKQEWYNREHTQFWDNWIRDVFNINTANDFGLSLWGRILDVPLSVTVQPTTGRPSWGFGVNNKNFGNAGFGRATAGQIGMTTEQRRIVIRMRYFQLTCRPTVTEVNAFLATLFGQGTVWVSDSLDMTFVTYVFRQVPDSQLTFILDNYDLLPRPSGVGVRYITQPRPSWGFGPNHLNFENGNFGA